MFTSLQKLVRFVFGVGMIFLSLERSSNSGNVVLLHAVDICVLSSRTNQITAEIREMKSYPVIGTRSCDTRSHQCEATHDLGLSPSDCLIRDFEHPVNPGGHQAEYKSLNDRWKYGLLFTSYYHFMFRENWGKMQMNETRRQNLERQHSWQ